jgi:hypothetical protein
MRVALIFRDRNFTLIESFIKKRSLRFKIASLEEKSLFSIPLKAAGPLIKLRAPQVQHSDG